MGLRLDQADALMRKNLIIQKRAKKMNCCVILYPLLMCSLMGYAQRRINSMSSEAGMIGAQCAICMKAPVVGDDTVGGMGCPMMCAVPRASVWPPLLQIPALENRAVADGLVPFTDLPNPSCRGTRSCAAAFLVTGTKRPFVESVLPNMIPSHPASVNASTNVSALADFVLAVDGTGPGSFSDNPLLQFGGPSFLQNRCTANLTLSYAYQVGSTTSPPQVLRCTEALMLWRDSSKTIDDELYRGYYQANMKNKSHGIAAAYDFSTSDRSNLNLVIAYNSSGSNINPPPPFLVPRLTNMASNAFLTLMGKGMKMAFDFVKQMPKGPVFQGDFDITRLSGQTIYVWIMQLLFRVLLTDLVYEKEKNLRVMMKMHGLGDLPYLILTYCYFLLLSVIYMLSFVIFAILWDLKFFVLNSYGVQALFYFVYVNVQISFTFFMATFFSKARTASVFGNFYIFASGLVAEYLFKSYIEDTSLSRTWVTLLEFVPAFSLYRILYEFANCAKQVSLMGFGGMRWIDLAEPENGMLTVLGVMVLEWFMFLLLAFYMDHFGSFQNGMRKAIALFHSRRNGVHFPAAQQQTTQIEESKASIIALERTDVTKEREMVEKLLQESKGSRAIICDNIKKVYSGQDGNAEKIAVRGLSLSMASGQCFGLLGSNGAGKTSLIKMLTGFTKPTSGTAYIEGMDIRWDMNKIYTSIGVCPQNDLLWEALTGKEHLMFYGRIKQLKGKKLDMAIEKSLKSVGLLAGGVGDKKVGQYSGGMKRRLSVAICLIGDPKVVYMDEPSTGLDPASRKDLWKVVKCSKKDKAIILTTHSMEEAEVLCDRIGIVANGSLQCIGNSKELKSKYGGTYVLTITTAEKEEEEVEKLVNSISALAKRVYHILGTQKFEIPKKKVKISDVFQAMENAKSRLEIIAWGLSDTTLEDVFIKVAKDSDKTSPA